MLAMAVCQAASVSTVCPQSPASRLLQVAHGVISCTSLWRGSLLPPGREAAPKRGLLRSPAGASSLATGFLVSRKYPYSSWPVARTATSIARTLTAANIAVISTFVRRRLCRLYVRNRQQAGSYRLRMALFFCARLWRGSLLPLGREAAPKRGLLRSPAGASSLATGFLVARKYPYSSWPVARTATSIARTLTAANIAVISTPLNPSINARTRETPSLGTSSP